MKWSLILVLLIHLLPAENLFAQNTIEEMEQGNCWYQEQSENWKIVSFGDQAQWWFQQNDIIDLKSSLEKLRKKELASDQHELEVFFLCHAAGSRILINWRTHDEAYILLVEQNQFADKRAPDLTIQKVFSNPEKFPGAYLGVIPGEMIIYLKNSSQLSLATQVLKNRLEIKDLSSVGARSLKVVLHEQFQFQESDFKKVLMQEFKNQHVEVTVEYNLHFLPVGGVLSLFESHF
jgi:hypothetical protein